MNRWIHVDALNYEQHVYPNSMLVTGRRPGIFYYYTQPFGTWDSFICLYLLVINMTHIYWPSVNTETPCVEIKRDNFSFPVEYQFDNKLFCSSLESR